MSEERTVEPDQEVDLLPRLEKLGKNLDRVIVSGTDTETMYKRVESRILRLFSKR